MSDRKSQLEPSMEEILASIRRILAEDEHNVPPPRARATADVLDLTEAIGEDGSVRHIEPAAMRGEAIVPPTFPDGRVEPAPPRPEVRGEGLLSEPAANAVSASFARLAATPRAPEPAVDDLVRETLRPMLQAWLDQNLPTLVERLVQAEIVRVMGDPEKR